MRLTIHIGPHKTGTTALQCAFANGERVLKGHGILYPRSNWMYPAQHRLAFALKERCIPRQITRPQREKEVAALTRLLDRKKPDHAFISSEEFFAAPPSAIAWLRDKLAIDKIDILAFLRRPDCFLVSCYNQKVRQPGNAFHAPIRRFLSDPGSIAPEINFLRHVSSWADVFGTDAVTLKSYEADAPLRQTLLHLGLPPECLPDVPNVNQSAPGAIVELIRHAKIAGFSEHQQRRLSKLANRVFNDGPAYFLPNEARLGIIKHFEEENNRLFDRFGLSNPYTASAFEPEPECSEQNLTIGDAMQLMRQLL